MSHDTLVSRDLMDGDWSFGTTLVTVRVFLFVGTKTFLEVHVYTHACTHTHTHLEVCVADRFALEPRPQDTLLAHYLL